MPLNDANIFNTRIDAQQYLRRQTTIQKYGAIAIICVCPYALINMYLNFDLFSDMRVYLTSMVWMLTAITASCAWTVAILCLKRNSKKYVVWIIGGYLGIAWSMMVDEHNSDKTPIFRGSIANGNCWNRYLHNIH